MVCVYMHGPRIAIISEFSIQTMYWRHAEKSKYLLPRRPLLLSDLWSANGESECHSAKLAQKKNIDKAIHLQSTIFAQDRYVVSTDHVNSTQKKRLGMAHRYWWITIIIGWRFCYDGYHVAVCTKVSQSLNTWLHNGGGCEAQYNDASVWTPSQKRKMLQLQRTYTSG